MSCVQGSFYPRSNVKCGINNQSSSYIRNLSLNALQSSLITIKSLPLNSHILQTQIHQKFKIKMIIRNNGTIAQHISAVYKWSQAFHFDWYIYILSGSFGHTHCNLPRCSMRCWILPSTDNAWFLTLAGIIVVCLTWNLGKGLWSFSSLIVKVSGDISSKNSSATSPSSSILRRLAYHLKPCQDLNRKKKLRI